jgi:hypothetical protein
MHVKPVDGRAVGRFEAEALLTVPTESAGRNMFEAWRRNQSSAPAIKLIGDIAIGKVEDEEPEKSSKKRPPKKQAVRQSKKDR